MNNPSVFDTLVSQLSTNERREMLVRLSQEYTASDEPIYTEAPEEPGVDLKEKYRTLSFFQKIILFLRSIISGRDRETVMEDFILKKIGKDIQSKIPNMVNISQNVFTSTFGEKIQILGKASRFFLDPLNRIMGSDFPEFTAFLSGMEDETYNRELFMATNPYKIAEANPDLKNRDIKRIMEGNLRDLLEQYPGRLKKKMYRNARFLQALFGFASFPFSKIESRFMPLEESVPLECPIFELKEELQELGDIMHSMKFSPSSELLNAIFLFAYNEKLSKENYDLAEDMQKKLKRANEAFNNIREFNQSFPWVSILRYATGNVYYRPAVIGGGEDWFMQFKQFWSKRLDKIYLEYDTKRQRQDLLSEMRTLFDLETIKTFDALSLNNPKGKNCYAISLSFTKTFFSEVFPARFNRPLKILLLDGDFYKENNREEYTDTYNSLLKMKGRIELLEGRFGPEGDIGMPLNALDSESVPDHVRKKRSEAILQIARQDSEELIQRFLKDLKIIEEVLNGILYGEIGGRYDTLSNLGQIEGRSNKKYMKDLDNVLRVTREARDILGRVYDLEKSISRKTD
jgi:hypothetical protein